LKKYICLPPLKKEEEEIIEIEGKKYKLIG